MADHGHGKAVLDALNPLHRELRRSIPGAARAGATKQEAAEAIGVTFVMKGGPATIYGPRAYAAFCESAGAQAAPAATGGGPRTGDGA
jgi:alkylhydroperoxidase/carboxymuconolactone decarboxylase family protein YurZ